MQSHAHIHTKYQNTKPTHTQPNKGEKMKQNKTKQSSEWKKGRKSKRSAEALAELLHKFIQRLPFNIFTITIGWNGRTRLHLLER